jgi:ComF family protein
MRLHHDMLQGLIHLFYPRLCEGCGKPLIATENVLCLQCSLLLPRTEYHGISGNETELKFAGRFPFQHATSLAYFTKDGLLQELLHGLKYRNKKEIGKYLGNELGKELLHTDWIKSIDVITPVPLHFKKQGQRGYYQAAVIAHAISEITQVPYDGDIIVRARDTQTQTRKTREERVDNMNDAFSIGIGKDIKGKQVLIIDDVLTTGATLEACAKTILKVPGTTVSMATIAIVA